MVMSPAEYKRLDVCILGLVRKLMRGPATSKTVTDSGTDFRTLLVQEQWRSPSAIELRIARLGLLQRVSNKPYGCRVFIAALFGSFPFESHDTVSDGKLCEHANPWARAVLTRHSRSKGGVSVGMFSTAAGGPNHGYVCSIGFFFRILDCSELWYCYLNITVAPPECLVVGAVVPGLLFPGMLPHPSSQEIHNCQCLPVVPVRLLQPHYNVTAHAEITGNCNLQCKKSVESTRSNLLVVLGMSDVST